MLRFSRTGILLSRAVGTKSKSRAPEILPKTLSFEKATPADLPALSKLFISSFIHDEPHARALRIGNEAVPLFEAIAMSCLQQPYCLKLIDTQTQKLAGFRLLSVGHRDPSKDAFPVKVEVRAPNVLTFVKLMESAKQLWLDALPHVNKFMRRDISYVIPLYQRKGVGARMLHYNLDLDQLKADGIQGIASEATSLANQRLLKLNGYREVAALPDSVYEKLNLEFQDGTRRIKCYFYEL